MAYIEPTRSDLPRHAPDDCNCNAMYLHSWRCNTWLKYDHVWREWRFPDNHLPGRKIKETSMKIHLENPIGSHNTKCGLRFWGLKILCLWFHKNKVTCKNCKR